LGPDVGIKEVVNLVAGAADVDVEAMRADFLPRAAVVVVDFALRVNFADVTLANFVHLAATLADFLHAVALIDFLTQSDFVRSAAGAAALVNFVMRRSDWPGAQVHVVAHEPCFIAAAAAAAAAVAITVIVPPLFALQDVDLPVVGEQLMFHGKFQHEQQSPTPPHLILLLISPPRTTINGASLLFSW